MKIYLLPLSLLFMLVISPSVENRSDRIQLVTSSIDLYLNGEKADAGQFEIGNSYKVLSLLSDHRFNENEIVSDLTDLILQMQNSSRFDFLVYVTGDSPILASQISKAKANEAIIPIFVDKENLFIKTNQFLEGKEFSLFLLNKDNRIIFSADSLDGDFKEFVLGIDCNLPKIIDSKLDYKIRYLHE